MSKNKDIAILDLHGFKHSDAVSECHSFLNEYWNSMQEAHIITGNSREMKSLVFGVLEQYDINYEEATLWNKGYIKVWF